MADSGINRRVVIWSAMASTALALIYIVGQLLEWQGVLGSAGGPESASTPIGIAVLLTPSLLLASAFVTLMAALHRFAPPSRSALSQAALAFATMYATLVSLVYFVQIMLVAPRMLAGDMAEIEFLRFVPYRSFLFAVDLLGYTFMSAATLFGAFALPDMPHKSIAKFCMILNGLILPFLAFQMLMPELIWGGALWGFTFPAATLALVAMFSAPQPAGGRTFQSPTVAPPSANSITP